MKEVEGKERGKEELMLFKQQKVDSWEHTTL